MEEVVKFFEKLSEAMSDVTWSVSGMTNYKEVTESENVYAELPDGSTFNKQDEYYLEQTQYGEDCFSGTVIYPITEDKAVIIHYDCQ